MPAKIDRAYRQFLGQPTGARVGMVSVNEYPITFPQTPFASAKNSGIGIEQSMHAIEHYTRLKNVSVKLD